MAWVIDRWRCNEVRSERERERETSVRENLFILKKLSSI